jgi:hypothetical protein
MKVGDRNERALGLECARTDRLAGGRLGSPAALTSTSAPFSEILRSHSMLDLAESNDGPLDLARVEIQSLAGGAWL